jgi:hypothetical protein
MNNRCVRVKRDGEQCSNPPIRGGVVCHAHGGTAPQVRAKAAVRAEVMDWGLGSVDVDPGEILLRLVSQSAARAQRYADELEQLVDDSPTLREALVGETWIAAGEDTSAYKAGEYIRGLAQLEAAERDRCAGFAAKAVAAGLAERQVKLAERQGQLLADVLRKVMADPALGLDETQRRAVPDLVRRHLAAVAG